MIIKLINYFYTRYDSLDFSLNMMILVLIVALPLYIILFGNVSIEDRESEDERKLLYKLTKYYKAIISILIIGLVLFANKIPHNYGWVLSIEDKGKVALVGKDLFYQVRDDNTHLIGGDSDNLITIDGTEYVKLRDTGGTDLSVEEFTVLGIEDELRERVYYDDAKFVGSVK